jgi:hypothetical protein
LTHEHWTEQLRKRHPLGWLDERDQTHFGLDDDGGRGISGWARQDDELDCVVLGGTEDALIILGGTMLNIARTDFDDCEAAGAMEGEWYLENPSPWGFGGVQAGSAEVGIFLEGSLPWHRGEVFWPTVPSILHDVGRDEHERIRRLPDAVQHEVIDALRSVQRYPRPEVQEIIARFETDDNPRT